MTDRPKKSLHAQHKARTKKHQTKSGAGADRQNKQAKDALEALFIPTDNPQAQKDWDSLAQLSNQDWQTKAIELITQYGYPAQAEHCVSLIDLEDATALKGLLTFIKDQWATYSASNHETLQKKIQVAAMMAFDDDLVDALEEFQRSINA